MHEKQCHVVKIATFKITIPKANSKMRHSFRVNLDAIYIERVAVPHNRSCIARVCVQANYCSSRTDYLAIYKLFILYALAAQRGKITKVEPLVSVYSFHRVKW